MWCRIQARKADLFTDLMSTWICLDCDCSIHHLLVNTTHSVLKVQLFSSHLQVFCLICYAHSHYFRPSRITQRFLCDRWSQKCLIFAAFYKTLRCSLWVFFLLFVVENYLNWYTCGGIWLNVCCDVTRDASLLKPEVILKSYFASFCEYRGVSAIISVFYSHCSLRNASFLHNHMEDDLTWHRAEYWAWCLVWCRCGTRSLADL